MLTVMKRYAGKMSPIQFSCNCNYSLITQIKFPVHWTWGLLRMCAACLTPRLNLSSELRPSWNNIQDTFPTGSAQDTTAVREVRQNRLYPETKPVHIVACTDSAVLPIFRSTKKLLSSPCSKGTRNVTLLVLPLDFQVLNANSSCWFIKTQNEGKSGPPHNEFLSKVKCLCRCEA